MRKILNICIIICATLILSACSSTSFNTHEKIISPNNYSIPIQGKWEVVRVLSNNYNNQEWSGKIAQFSSEAVMIGEYIRVKPNYKIKKVNSKEYFLSKHKDIYEKLKVYSKDIYVVTITSLDNFLYDFAKINENELLVEIQDSILLLRKISNEVDSEFYNKIRDIKEPVINSTEEDNLLRSGVMLGIRAPININDEQEEYQYRTLWISSESRELNPILETDDIFLPRRNGFWKVEVKRIEKEAKTEDVILAHHTLQDDLKKMSHIEIDSTEWKYKAGHINKKILYIGNDYLSTEINGEGQYINSNLMWNINKFQVLPVDNIENVNGIKISDVAGGNGALTLKSAKSSLVNDLGIYINEVNKEREQENFALVRKNGHWFTKGRLNYEVDNTEKFLDFDINLIPSSKLVFYDILQVSWSNIKDRVPDAIDAYTSPNKDFALIISDSKLYIYSINKGVLSDFPTKRMELNTGDRVVMAEWATGEYVENWEKIFKNNNVRVIN